MNVPIIKSTKVFNRVPGDYETNAIDAINYSSAGFIDSDYNPYNGPNKGVNDVAFLVRQQPDNKTLVFGFFSNYNNQSVNNLIRLNQDGSIDTTFNVEVYGFINDIVFYDSRILLCGNFWGVNDVYSPYIARIDLMGNVDTTFAKNISKDGGFSGTVNSIDLGKTGQIIACGNFEGFNNNSVNGFVQLNMQGTLCESCYNSQVFFNNESNTVKVQPDGKILIGGDFTNLYDQKTDDNYNVGYFVRLNIDGSLDFTFNTDGYPVLWSENTPFSSTTTGSIYFSNDAYIVGDTDINVWDIQLNPFTFEWFQYFTGNLSSQPTVFDFIDGYLTVYFGENNTITLYVNGSYYSFNLNSSIENTWSYFAITRQDNDPSYPWIVFQDGIQIGTFDNGIPYGQGQPLIIGGPSDYTKGNLGVGYFTGYITNFRVTNGAAIYTSNYPVPTEPLTHDEGPGNTILLLSVIDSANLIDDSSDDSVQFISFGNINSGFDDYVYKIELDKNNDIFVISNSSVYNGDYVGYGLTKINNVGEWISDFQIGDGFDGNVNDIKIQEDGKVIVVGKFNAYYSAQGNFYPQNIIRLNTDGSADISFLPVIIQDGFNDEAVSIVLDNDGNAIVGGWFTEYFIYSVGNCGWFVCGGVAKLHTKINTALNSFDICNTNDTKSIRVPFGSPAYYGNTIKGEINTRSAICGYSFPNQTSVFDKQSGSIYFSGDDYIYSDSSSDWNLLNNDFTIEWFQYRENSGGCCPRIFTLGQVNIGGATIAVSIESGEFYLWLNGNSYNFGDLSDYESWTAFAITRTNNLFRVFKNGVEVFEVNSGQPILYMSPLNNDYDQLIIGNDPSDGSSQYVGYITNFRWINGNCLYTSNYEVSLYPLSIVDYTSTLLLASDENDWLLDDTGNHTFYEGNPTPTDWNSFNPFVVTYELYNYSDKRTIYGNCGLCLSTEKLQAITYQRDGVNPNKVVRTTLTQEHINNLRTLGPIWTNGPFRECYELLTYYK